MEQPLSFISSLVVCCCSMSCVYREFPNGVGKDQPHILWFSMVPFKSFAGPMATPAGEFVFVGKPSSNLFVQSDGVDRNLRRRPSVTVNAELGRPAYGPVVYFAPQHDATTQHGPVKYGPAVDIFIWSFFTFWYPCSDK